MIEMWFKITSNEHLVLYADVFPQQKKILSSSLFGWTYNLKKPPHSEYWRELGNETMGLKYFKTLIVEFERGKTESRNAFLCKGNHSSMVSAKDGRRWEAQAGDLGGIKPGIHKVSNRCILIWLYITCIAWVYPWINSRGILQPQPIYH